MQFAYQFPERCERLVLVSSGGLGHELHLILRAAALPGAEWVLPVLCSNALCDAVDGVARFGEPFVGAAGKLLATSLSEIGLSRTQVFITNVVKCRPPENRDPLLDEIEMCTPYLNRQIGIIQPAVIITLGKHSTACLLNRANLPFRSITQEHGKVHEAVILGVQTVVFPTFHPAAALYNARYENQIRDDFQIVKKELLKRELITE